MEANYEPKTYEIPNPTGVDKAISLALPLLRSLSWLEKVYGRATIQVENKSEREQQSRLAAILGQEKKLRYPRFYGQNGEVSNLMPNDNVKAMSFFYVKDPIRYLDGEDNFMQSQVMVSQPIELIVWVNLSQIYPKRVYDWSQELHRDLVRVMGKWAAYTPEQSYQQFDKVYADFSVPDTYRKFNQYPYWAIRFSGTITYPLFSENGLCCGPDSLKYTDEEDVIRCVEYAQGTIELL